MKNRKIRVARVVGHYQAEALLRNNLADVAVYEHWARNEHDELLPKPMWSHVICASQEVAGAVVSWINGSLIVNNTCIAERYPVVLAEPWYFSALVFQIRICGFLVETFDFVAVGGKP
jgi:hypothetical protein